MTMIYKLVKIFDLFDKNSCNIFLLDILNYLLDINNDCIRIISIQIFIMTYIVDNIIQWIFEKIFDQITIDCKDIYNIPFEKIKNKTFNNNHVYELINKLTNRQINVIKEYLNNHAFQKKFLFNKLKNKISVAILLNNDEYIYQLLNIGYKINYKNIQLIVLNNKLIILQNLLDNYSIPKLNNDLLSYCCEFNYEDMYFYLRKLNLMPNISIYNKAASSNNLSIIIDISSNIGLTSKILNTAFESNNIIIMEYLIDVAIKENIKINPNLLSYVILNANYKIFNKLEELNLINWYNELYYSAILSSSFDMIKLIERNIPKIHYNNNLDTSKTKKGQSSLLLEDMIYHYNNKKYLSHTINYGIQSGSKDMLQYLLSKKYQITLSNILTAIKQSTVEILQFVMEIYNKELPSYFIYYFGLNSYIPYKFDKAKYLIDNNFLNLKDNVKLQINDYRKESIHQEMISQQIILPEEGINDIDYLMKYYNFLFQSKDTN